MFSSIYVLIFLFHLRFIIFDVLLPALIMATVSAHSYLFSYCEFLYC